MQESIVREELTYESEAEWRALRKGLVTSTAMAGLLGVSKYKTPYEVWFEIARDHESDFTESERMKWGKRLESVIAEGVAEDEGWKVEPFKTFYRLPDYRCGSSFDYKILNNDEEPEKTGILEIKNVDGLIFRDEWLIEDGDVIEAPPDIEVQIMFQLFVSGLDYITVCAFVGGNKPIKLKRYPDEEMFELFKKELNDFNETVKKDEPPEIDWHRDAEFIRKIYQVVEPGTQIDLTGNEDIETLASNYLLLGKKKKQIEDEQDAIKAQIYTQIGDVEKGVHPDFSITAGYVGPTQVSFVRKGYRNFRVNPKKHLKERIKDVEV